MPPGIGYPPGMPPMPPMGGPGMMPPPPPPQMGGMPGMTPPMGQPPELALLMESLASAGGPQTSGNLISQAVSLLNQARKLDDTVAPVVGRAIDILKGCEDYEDEDEGSPHAGPGPKSKSDY